MTLWGGRFTDAPGDALWRFTVDETDRRLLPYDVAGSAAHAEMLETVGLISADDAAAIHQGLGIIEREVHDGSFRFDEGDEDVHTAVERRLRELIGEPAGRLHTGRSRNDQVVLDLRMYLRRAASERIGQLRGFIELLATLAVRYDRVVVASYTHLQQAQATTLGHHLLAYGWMLLRDAERFAGCVERLAVSPLGAGASAGSSLPLDPHDVARALGFAAVFDNSLDAVASRDFVSEYAFCCAQAMTHLSRLSEELVLWSTTEFSWVSFSDRDTTGSSALPHKKNPDVAELTRGRAASAIGDVASLLALQKGLPLAYNRDLQEDKRAVFHADDVLSGALAALADMLEGATFSPPPPSPWVVVLDLAEALVRRGVPFREAHAAVGGLVRKLTDDGKTVADVTAEDLTEAHPSFAEEDVLLVDVSASIERRATPGSGSPASVGAQAADLRRRSSAISG